MPLTASIATETGFAPTWQPGLMSFDYQESMTAARVERLPFSVKVVSTSGELERAVKVRYEAYARHVPEFAASMKGPEPADIAPDTVVLLAESKLDASAERSAGHDLKFG
jgi:hypothetical protein